MAPDERRRAIVDAVIPLLVHQGSAVTTRQIAEAAGVAEGTLFRVFPDKGALLHAAARAVFDPARGRASLEAIPSDLDLEAMVRAAADVLLAGMRQTIAVMIAVRGALVEDPDQGPDQGRDLVGGPKPAPGEGPNERTGPPAFIREANQAVLEALTVLFERYADELRLSPVRAAVVLRGLVLGIGHPGMNDDNQLTPDEVASVVVSGVARGDDR
ncbi:MAG TPA: TetR/AcrR family transcriptional regulator [Nocardioidaceae bacterium]|nr:TetR/AcrR family transcriptional regulator [Nocardioidaceae bacterium]